MTRTVLMPGRNIALKTPAYAAEATFKFYQDGVGLKRQPGSDRFEFGSMYLWIDVVEGISQSEVWLEFATDDLAKARSVISQFGSGPIELEKLPEGYRGFWCRSPAGVVHLVSLEGE
jgi:hypothetical protein